MAIKKFEEIQSWQKSKELSIAIYYALGTCRDWAFKDQLQRASVSIMNNIAEGYERDTNKEFKHFLFIAKGSCGEVRSTLYLAEDLNYFSKSSAQGFRNQAVEISKLISGLIKTL